MMMTSRFFFVLLPVFERMRVEALYLYFYPLFTKYFFFLSVDSVSLFILGKMIFISIMQLVSWEWLRQIIYEIR